MINDRFYIETRETFAFLEEQFEYLHQQPSIENANDPRDEKVVVPYLSNNSGVEIEWYFASSTISVVFIELQQPYTFPMKRVAIGKRAGAARVISLNTLAEMLGFRSNAFFLLGDIDNVMPSKCNRRAKLIQANMQGVLDGLAQATQLYATPILNGDTSLFPEVMQYYTQKMKLLYP